MTAIILTICAVAIVLVVSAFITRETEDPMQDAFGDIPAQTKSGPDSRATIGARGQRLQQSIHPVVQATSRFGRKHP